MKKIIFTIAILLMNFCVLAQIEKFPDYNLFRQKWKIINNDSSTSNGIGCIDELNFAPKYPATYFKDSTGCMGFDVFCFNPSKGYSDDYAIRRAPYKINRQDSLVLWYGSFVNWKNWTTGQMFYKIDTIEIVYAYLDSAILARDTTYPNASHMQHLGYLITTQDSIVMTRYSQSLSNLLSGLQTDTAIYLGFRKHMFTQDCAAWIDNVYLSYSGINSTKVIPSYSFEVYPNPAKDFISIRTDELISRISIKDISGKLLINNSKNETTLDISRLTPGVYFIEVTTKSGKTSTKKWIKE